MSKKSLGINNGQLAPCPNTPNCVSSQAPVTDKQHYMAPIAYHGTRERARDTIQTIINAMPRTQIKAERDDYIYATFTSATFGFVDDVEFYFPPDKNSIHFRSASRIGYSDFNVNRKRMQHIKEQFAQYY